MPDHHPNATLAAIVAMPFVLAIVLYLGAVASERRRGRSWPWWRTLAWLVGAASASIVAVGPLLGGQVAEAWPFSALGHRDFASHAAGHVVIGMLAPLLLVLAAPVTLALRALDVVPARRLSRLLKSGPVRVVSHPVTATLLNVGSLWVLYTTDVFAEVQSNSLLGLAVHVHFLLAGYLFTAAIIGVDPTPHRPAFPVRAAVLVFAFAAHAILAKYLFGHPPTGVITADAEAGALVMYYAGDAVDVAIMTVLCWQVYRAAGRRLERVAAASV